MNKERKRERGREKISDKEEAFDIVIFLLDTISTIFVVSVE